MRHGNVTLLTLAAFIALIGCNDVDTETETTDETQNGETDSGSGDETVDGDGGSGVLQPARQAEEILDRETLDYTNVEHMVGLDHVVIVEPYGANPYLWFTDGSDDNTERFELPDNYRNVKLYGGVATGSAYYFLADPVADEAADIWVTDGSVAGTERLLKGKDLGIGSSISHYRGMASHEGHVAFVAYNGHDSEYQLYLTDESPEGASQVTGISPSLSGIGDRLLVHDSLFHVVHSEDDSHSIQSVNPDTGDTLNAFDLEGGDTSAPHSLVSVGGKLFFTANDGDGWALWTTGGRTFDPSSSSANMKNARRPTAVGNKVFFFTNPWDPDLAWDGDFRSQCSLAVSDGTEEGTEHFGWEELGSLWNCSDTLNMHVATTDSHLVFTAPYNPDDGRAWWRASGADDMAPIRQGGNTIDSASTSNLPEGALSIGNDVWLLESRYDLHFIQDGQHAFELDPSLALMRHLVTANGELWLVGRVNASHDDSVWRVPLETVD